MTDGVRPPAVPPEVAAAQHVLQMSTGFIVSAALQVALKLEIAEKLADGPLSSAELAKAAGVNEDALYRVLRALAMVGIFAETAPRTFTLTPPANMLRAGVPGGVRELALWISDPFHFRVYAETMLSVKTGKPAGDAVVGMPVFEYLSREPELSATFNNAMTSFSASVIPAVLATYDFSGINVLVDIAGGHGMVLGSILQKYPEMRGVLFDLDHVLAGAKPLDTLGVRARVTTASGDFFTSVPAGGDAYLMKHIIHDWDDERATTILKNIRGALAGKPQGKLILIEAVIQPGNQPDFSKLIDLEMLLLPGGRERTADEFAALLAGAGFEMTRIVPTPSPLWVVEGKIR